jgi:hypothetical protein
MAMARMDKVLFHSTIANNSEEVDTYNYDAFVYWNGCSSDTLTFEVDVLPAPNADFVFNPNPVIEGASATFTVEWQFFCRSNHQLAMDCRRTHAAIRESDELCFG